MKRLHCTLFDKQGVNGHTMEESQHGNYIDIFSNRDLVVHAVMGCTAPYDKQNMVNLNIIKFVGNHQHNYCEYEWVYEKLIKMHMDDLLVMYEEFKK